MTPTVKISSVLIKCIQVGLSHFTYCKYTYTQIDDRKSIAIVEINFKVKIM